MSVDVKKVIQRMKQVLKTDQIKTIAEGLGISGNAISNWPSKGKVSNTAIVTFGLRHNVSINWLLTGKGSQDVDDNRYIVEERLFSKYPYLGGILEACREGDSDFIKRSAEMLIRSLDA